MNREPDGRVPPHNDEAEKSVLGALMLDRDALYEVMEILKADDFYSASHGKIFTAAAALHAKGEPVDALTLSDELKRQKDLELIGGRGYVAALSTMVPATSNAAQYAKIVAEKALLRRLIAAAADIADDGFRADRDAREILDAAERGIFEIARAGQRSDYTHIKESLWENVNRMEELSKIKGLTGLTTGFADLDKKTSGLQKSDLIIVAARPGMGKTAFALNIAHRAAVRAEAKVLIFSLEMSKNQLVNRLISMESRVDITRLRDGKLDAEDWERIHGALDVLSDAAIYMDDAAGVTALEIKNKCRRLKAEKGLDLIIVDYLQLMSADGRSENRQQEISGISRMLKQLAKETDCPVIVLSQLSRAVEQRGVKKPILSDLRESGSIEQDADIVVFLYREDYYNEDVEEDERNLCEVNIAKHRNGETGSVELDWIPNQTRFKDRPLGGESY